MPKHRKKNFRKPKDAPKKENYTPLDMNALARPILQFYYVK